MYKHDNKKQSYITTSFFRTFSSILSRFISTFKKNSNPTTHTLDPRTHKCTCITGKKDVRAQRVKTSLFPIPTLMILFGLTTDINSKQQHALIID